MKIKWLFYPSILTKNEPSCSDFPIWNCGKRKVGRFFVYFFSQEAFVTKQKNINWPKMYKDPKTYSNLIDFLSNNRKISVYEYSVSGPSQAPKSLNGYSRFGRNPDDKADFIVMTDLVEKKIETLAKSLSPNQEITDNGLCEIASRLVPGVDLIIALDGYCYLITKEDYDKKLANFAETYGLKFDCNLRVVF